DAVDVNDVGWPRPGRRRGGGPAGGPWRRTRRRPTRTSHGNSSVTGRDWAARVGVPASAGSNRWRAAPPWTPPRVEGSRTGRCPRGKGKIKPNFLAIGRPSLISTIEWPKVCTDRRSRHEVESPLVGEPSAGEFGQFFGGK